MDELYLQKCNVKQTMGKAAQNPEKVKEMKAECNLYWQKVTKGDRDSLKLSFAAF